jgi:hypothetical protein
MTMKDPTLGEVATRKISHTAMSDLNHKKWVMSDEEDLPYSDEGSHSHRSGSARRGRSSASDDLVWPHPTESGSFTTKKIFHTAMKGLIPRSGSQPDEEDLPYSDEGSHSHGSGSNGEEEPFHSDERPQSGSQPDRRSHSDEGPTAG